MNAHWLPLLHDDIVLYVVGLLAIFKIYRVCQTLTKSIEEKEALLHQYHAELKRQEQENEEDLDTREGEQ